MAKNLFEVGKEVTDRWFAEWGIGVVEKVLKTRIHVRFADQMRIYDNDHLQFLKVESAGRKKVAAAKKTKAKGSAYRHYRRRRKRSEPSLTTEQEWQRRDEVPEEDRCRHCGGSGVEPVPVYNYEG